MRERRLSHLKTETTMSRDSQLQQAVIAELGWEPSVDSAHIGVSTHDGVVTLNGHVGNFSQKLAAEKAASRVKGVMAVAEEIDVKLPFDIERGDEAIAAAAIERLAWDSSIPRDAVKVRVEKGWVTLSGEVDWHFQKEAAAQNIRVLHGVVGVSNQLGIKPTVNASNVSDEITHALHRSWFYDPNSIKVTARGGEIKLTGNVTTWNARNLAATTAWSAPGATSVENEIRVVS
jgi:osmotically-inducible protein OsmY